MDSRTNPLAPNLVGDDTVDGEIQGENEPLKMDEGASAPPPGALDYAYPDTSPTEDHRSDPALDTNPNDPGQVPGSRDPDLSQSVEHDDQPGARDGNTPGDAEGAMGSEGG